MIHIYAKKIVIFTIGSLKIFKLIIYLIISILLYSCLVLACNFAIKFRKTAEIVTPACTQGISVLIAMRNEMDNLPFQKNQLLDILTDENVEVVIIDDHSDDGSSEWLKNNIMHPRFRFFHLPDGLEGKKNALKYGLDRIACTLVIMTDADCIVQPGWALHIAGVMEKEKASMLIGPVMLKKGHTFFENLQMIEFTGIQALTAGTALLGLPVSCNGANLAYNTDSLAVLKTGLSSPTPSGDDIFVLHELKKNRKKISCTLSPKALVITNAEKKIPEFLNQRSRWAKKTIHFRYLPSVIVLLIISNLYLSFLLSVFLTLAHIQFLIACLGIFAVKTLADTLLITTFALKTGFKLPLRYILPAGLFSVIYPPILFFYTIFTTIQWKGRKI